MKNISKIPKKNLFRKISFFFSIFIFFLFFLSLSISFFSLPHKKSFSFLSSTISFAKSLKSFAAAEDLPEAYSSPLQPVRLDNPRSTMASYLEAMKDYKKGLEQNDEKLLNRINDAARTFNLKGISFVLRKKAGKKAALLLKEILDRVILIDLNRIPKQLENKDWWRLKGTEITISKEKEGDHAGEYLFSPETTFRLEEFYKKIKHLDYLEGSGKGAGYKAPWQETYIPQWIKDSFFGLKKWQWLGLFISFLFGIFIKLICDLILLKMETRLKNLKIKQEGLNHFKKLKRKEFLHALNKPLGFFLMSSFWLFILYNLQLPNFLEKNIGFFIQTLLSFSVLWFIYRLVGIFTLLLLKIAKETKNPLDDQVIPFVEKFLRILILIIGGLVIIQNLGFNVMSLVAGLGLGGLAFALAAKDMASNLFGSLMILMDRPFQIGDWIVAGDIEGTVEGIGFRSTHIRTFYNSLVSIPNSFLANVSIDNMGQRSYRRVKTYLGITYGTPLKKINQFIEGIKEILRTEEYTKKEDFHVVLNQYGESSLNILLYFFLKTSNWGIELKEREKIFLKIYKLAETLDVHFAFPTRSLFIEGVEKIKKEIPLLEKNKSKNENPLK